MKRSAGPPLTAARTGEVLANIQSGCGTGPDPGDPAVPWHRAAAVPELTRSALGRKNHAAQCFSAASSNPPVPDSPPILPPFVLPRLLAVGELVFR